VNQRPDHMRNNNNRNRNNNNNNNRNRNNNNRGGGGGQRNNGMNDARARGNAQQLLEKYKNMARDAAQNGDRVLAEYYMQFADHYFRVFSEYRARFEEQRVQEQRANGTFDENENRNSHDDDIEGVDSVDLAQPSGFGPATAVQSFGADAAPTATISTASIDETVVSDTSAPHQAADAELEDTDAAPRNRNRRGRGRARRPESENNQSENNAAATKSAPVEAGGE
jgi:Domain of unknown function (DUF4167)